MFQDIQLKGLGLLFLHYIDTGDLNEPTLGVVL